jgi:hypothetical protein
MTDDPPAISNPVARAHWHLELEYDLDDQVIDERSDQEFREPAECWNCGGEGFVIVCCDDLCHGAGYCFHGNGHAICKECNGEGTL